MRPLLLLLLVVVVVVGDVTMPLWLDRRVAFNSSSFGRLPVLVMAGILTLTTNTRVHASILFGLLPPARNNTTQEINCGDAIARNTFNARLSDAPCGTHPPEPAYDCELKTGHRSMRAKYLKSRSGSVHCSEGGAFVRVRVFTFHPFALLLFVRMNEQRFGRFTSWLFDCVEFNEHVFFSFLQQKRNSSMCVTEDGFKYSVDDREHHRFYDGDNFISCPRNPSASAPQANDDGR